MKSREVLSVVLSLIMIFGVSAGSAYAQTDTEVNLDESLEVTDDTTREVDDDTVEDEIDDERDDDVNETENDSDEALKSLEDAREEIQRATEKITDAQDAGEETSAAEIRLEEAKTLLQDAEAAFELGNFDEAEDLAEDAKDFASESRMKYLGKTIEELDDDRDEHEDDRDGKHEDDRDHEKDLRDKLNKYCELSDEDKRKYIAEHDKTAEKAEKMNRFCTLNETDRADFIAENIDEYKAYMKDKMHDGMKDKKHMDYDRLCALSESDRALEFDDSEKLERISNWCNMTPEEQEEYKKEKHDTMKEKRQDALTRIQENPNIPQHIKEMITDKRVIVDERLDEIRIKYEEKHGDLDEKKLELKIKFKDHMSKIKIEISEERKSAIKDRVAEMKAFKMELRDSSSELTDEEKQGLRAEFIEMAKDIRLAWVSPHQQMKAGIDSAEIECREGFSHVMKESNGKAMCLKANTALEMIERGIAVPAI